ncbi:MAG: hypothetical protein CML23_12485 [Rhizobiaceae bacterium]|nr:hypothetical protein [Rhizobiaceae bacterium]
MKLRLIAALSGTLAMLSTVAAAADVDFAGKTVRIVQNYGAGGSTDLFARTIAPFIQKYLPGEPTVVVEPKPGAAGIQAGIYMHNSSKPDGMEICLCNSMPVRWVTVNDFEFDLRDLAIAGSHPVNTVVLIRDEMNVSKPTDLASTPKPLLFSATSPASENASRFVVFADIFGAKVNIIGGYQLAGNMVQSVTQGETTVTSLNSDYYAVQSTAIAEAGTVKPFGQVGVPNGDGFDPEPEIDAPTFDSMVREYAPEVLGTPKYKLFSAFNQAAAAQMIYLLAPGTPQEYVDAWQDAIAKAVVDPDYVKAVVGMEATVRPFTGEEGTRKMLDALYEGFKSPDVEAILRQLAPVYFK